MRIIIILMWNLLHTLYNITIIPFIFISVSLSLPYTLFFLFISRFTIPDLTDNLVFIVNAITTTSHTQISREYHKTRNIENFFSCARLWGVRKSESSSTNEHIACDFTLCGSLKKNKMVLEEVNGMEVTRMILLLFIYSWRRSFQYNESVFWLLWIVCFWNFFLSIEINTHIVWYIEMLTFLSRWFLKMLCVWN